jgi:hypothetical protein
VRTIRIFISSPGDVGEEREVAVKVIERLQYEYARRLHLDPILWEHEPLRATAHFQEQLPSPAQSDICVFILWSRLGTRLPAHMHRPDGSTYQSGTEFEFEHALTSFRERGVPDLLTYRKTTRSMTTLDSEQEVLELLAQKKALDAFIQKWFLAPDGSFTAAFHAFQTANQFEELLEKHLKKLLEPNLREAGEQGATPAAVWAEESPFRGLEVFDLQHALIFCGRAAAISEVLDALRNQAAAARPFLLVLGMSGVGKSSLIRAGVLSRLLRPGVIEGIGLWRHTILRPSDAWGDLLEGLALALLRDSALPELARGGMSGRELAQVLRTKPEAAIPLLTMSLAQAAAETAVSETLSRRPNARLAVVVDQLEEIFTLKWITPDERKAFMSALQALVRSGNVWVIATLRSDAYQRCAEIPELLTLKEGYGQYELKPPSPVEIGQMIRQPTRMAGLRFEENPETQEQLDDVLRDAAVRDPGALPLLEFTLEELYERRSADGLLTFEAYRSLGGVEGALARRAEDIFATLEPSVQAALSGILNTLVTVDLRDPSRMTRRPAPLESATATPEGKSLVEAFVSARLFVVDRADDGTPVLRVAHEALLHRWPRIQAWHAANVELLRRQSRIASAAAVWQSEGRHADFLLAEGQPLDEAEDLLAARHFNLPFEVTEYVTRSTQQRRSRHKYEWLAAGVLATLFCAIVIASGMEPGESVRDAAIGWVVGSALLTAPIWYVAWNKFRPTPHFVKEIRDRRFWTTYLVAYLLCIAAVLLGMSAEVGGESHDATELSLYALYLILILYKTVQVWRARLRPRSSGYHLGQASAMTSTHAT